MDGATTNVAYPLLTAVLLLTLLQTLRLSITGRIHADKPNFVMSHLWLYPLGVLGPLVIGAFYKGLLSPWPPAAYAKMAGSAGLWAGLAAFLAVLIVDIWLFWAGAKAIRATTLTSATFRPLHDRLMTYYHVVNVLVGVFILYRVWAMAAAG